jgi:hypothetical protein
MSSVVGGGMLRAAPLTLRRLLRDGDGRAWLKLANGCIQL